jgi:hypothetical protein
VHVFSGCYRDDVLRAIGGWDERLLANEDFEADLRVAESGSVVYLDPSAQSTWYVREHPVALARQMWRYGFYKGLTLRLHPRSLQPRQLAPLVLVAGLLGAAVVHPRLAAVGVSSYAAVSGALGARAARSDGASAARGAPVPAIVHLSWGSGLLVGLVRFSFARRRVRTAGSGWPDEHGEMNTPSTAEGREGK